MSIRRRSKRACLPCRNRKRRCDGECPCRTCLEFEYNCTYVQEPQRTALRHESSSASSLRNTDIPDFQRTFSPDRSDDKVLEPNKQRFYDASSAISFPRALGLWLDTDHSFRVHSFAYNVGIVPEPFLELPERRLSNILDLSTAQKLSMKYFEVVNRLFRVVVSEQYYQQLLRLWTNPPGMLHFESLACFVVLLGSFHTIPSQLDNHQELFQYAQDLLDRSNLCTAPSLMHVEHFQAWILRTIYARSTTRPNVAWLSSCITLHIAESLGIHRECDTLGEMGIERINEVHDVNVRRRLFWIAWMLNRLISSEVGRNPTWLTDITTKRPSRESDSVDIKAIELYLILYPDGDSNRIQDSQACLNTLATQAQAEGAEQPHMALIRAEMALYLYRDMHKHSTQSLERSGKRFVTILWPALLAVQKLVEAIEPWWWLTSIPFQCVCASISIGNSRALQMAPEALRLLQAANALFDTRMTSEAYESAQQLLRAVIQSKDASSATVNNALSTASHWDNMVGTNFRNFDAAYLTMGDNY